jgi:hypothetical protein
MGNDAIHPLKFKTFNSKAGTAIIAKFKDACSEDDFKKFIAEKAEQIKEENKKHLKEVVKKKEDQAKKKDNKEG